MSKILKNQTGAPVPIVDTGQTVPASGQLTIDPNDYALYAASSNTVTLVGAVTLVVNDGSIDLTISDGIDLIKGIFPTTVTIDDTDPVDVDVITMPPVVIDDTDPVDVEITNQPTVTIDDDPPVNVKVRNDGPDEQNDYSVENQFFLLRCMINEQQETNHFLKILLDLDDDYGKG